MRHITLAKQDELAVSKLELLTYSADDVLATVGRITAYHKAVSDAIYNMKACLWRTILPVVKSLMIYSSHVYRRSMSAHR